MTIITKRKTRQRPEVEERLITAIVPTVPVWAVYFDADTDSLGAEPVLFFNVWEHTLWTDGEPTRGVDIRPVPFSREPLQEESNFDRTENFLGLSLVPDPSREAFKSAIADYRARNARQGAPVGLSTVAMNYQEVAELASADTFGDEDEAEQSARDPFEILKGQLKFSNRT
jgi:hypothetical protein